jgi:hypothetical protein
VIPRIAEDADFVFDLHHQHGAIAVVDILDVLHERGEGTGIGFLCGGALGAEDFNLGAILDDAWKAAGILLDPDRRVAGHAVFPRSEPEKDDAQMVVAGLIEQTVDERKVVLPFCRLDEFPAEGSDHGVEVHRSEPGPEGLQVVQARRRGVVQFATEDEERLPVHDELGGCAAFLKVWCGVLLRPKWVNGEGGKQQRD